MSTFMILMTTFILLVGGFILWFVYVNNADPRLFEMVTPVAGALLISLSWVIKTIYTEAPEPTRLRTSIVNIEYIRGGQIPIHLGLLNKPFDLANNLLWNRYITQWNKVFLNQRKDSNYEDIYKAESIHFQFLEYFILKELSERFGLGWDHDSGLLFNTPWGRSGSESYGIPREKFDRIFLKKLVSGGENPNIFISEDKQDEYYQLAVPKGCTVNIERSENKTSIKISNRRFSFKFDFEMSNSIFTAHAIRDSIAYPLFQQLLKKYGPLGNATSTEEIRMRNFTLNYEFQQSKLQRFNTDADLDAKFANNIWHYFADNISWPKLESWYQEAAFN
jgi:hypothetical protein